MQFNSKLKKETFWGIATKAVTFPLFFITNWYLARFFGKELWGSWSYFFSFFTILYLMGQFGIRAGQKFVAQHNGDSELKSVITASLSVKLLFGGIVSILVFAFSTPFSNWIVKPEFDVLFKLGAILIFVGSLTEWVKGMFMGLHRIKYNFLVSVIEFALKLILVIVLLNYSANLPSVLYAFIIATFIALLAGAHFLFWNFYYPLKNEILAKKWVTEIIQYSIPLFIISLGFMLATEVDTIMLGWMVGDVEAGYYALPKQLATKLPHIAYALAMGSMPVFAKLNHENYSSLKTVFLKLLKTNALIFVPITILILSSSWFFVPFIYGTEFAPSVPAFMVLSIYILIFTFSVFFNQFLDYQGRAKKRALNLVFSIILNIALNILLIPKYGATGAAISTSLAYLPYLILNIVETKRVFSLHK